MKGLHHVEMYVADLARSTEFWGWFLPQLGYVPFQAWDAGRSWRLNESYLVFVQALDRHVDEPYHRRRVGLNHLAFWAESRDQVNALTEQVRARGLPVLYEDRHPYAGGPDHYALLGGVGGPQSRGCQCGTMRTRSAPRTRRVALP